MNVLLAKSPRADVPKTLIGHTEDDIAAFEALFGVRANPSPLGADWLRFFRLTPSDWDRFWTNAVASVALHDLGKANDGFQSAVQHGTAQILRHEQLSAFLLLNPQVVAWLSAGPAIDPDLVMSAVLSHHLKAAREEIGRALGDRSVLRFLAEHPEINAIFSLLAERLQMPPAVFELPSLWSFADRGESILDHADRLAQRFRRLERALRRNQPKARLLRAVKAALIAADSAGSGLAREGHDINRWITELFAARSRVNGDYIHRYVLARRIGQIEARSGTRFCYHGFQDQAADMPPRTLMIAPCGAGKTLAAWRWIEAQLAQAPRGHVIFLYPTRATATEGFRDYVAHAPESDASLLTGTAAYELRDMFSNPGESRSGADYLADARLYALGYWNKRVFSATVDQFLSFMQQSYKGLCLLPVLADAVVVVDEVHSFDVGLFDAFLKFLEHFDLPVLAMTASLPVRRRQALEAQEMQLFTGAGLEDLAANAALERYAVERVTDDVAAEAQVRGAIGLGDNVLWVVNTVDRAQALTQRLADLRPICYHSRFTLDDRKQRHAQVIEAFQGPAARGQLAITTQVCEMSLDLDARMLVSEQAPIPSLIQRMGRCNRHARPGANIPGRVLLYPPEMAVPYDPDEMALAGRFVDDIAGQMVSQARLEELLERFTQGGGREADRWTAFLDDGPWAADRGDQLRDADDHAAQAVLDIVVDAFRRDQRAGRPTDGYILPVPRSLAVVDERLPRYLRSAPAHHYDPRLGFLKQPAPAAGREGQ